MMPPVHPNHRTLSTILPPNPPTLAEKLTVVGIVATLWLAVGVMVLGMTLGLLLLIGISGKALIVVGVSATIAYALTSLAFVGARKLLGT